MDRLVTSKSHDRTIINFADLGIEDVYVVGKYCYLDARPQLETHVHPNMMEICYCEKGQQVYEVNKNEYRLKGGDVFVTFPDEPHSTAEYPEDKGTLYWIQITIPNEGQTFLGYHNEYATTLRNTVLSLPVRHFKGNVSIKKILEDLLLLGEQP